MIPVVHGETFMAKTALHLTKEEMAVYRACARQRETQAQQNLQLRAQHAQQIAQKAADILKEEYGAKKVFLFGSLAQDRFHQRSDIDLAVEGIPSKQFWPAWNALDALGSEFEINLVAMETASPQLCQQIIQHGVKL
jgi:uncharacterized protein